MLLLFFVTAEVERLVYDMVIQDPKTLELFEIIRATFDYSPDECPVAESIVLESPKEWRPSGLQCFVSKVWF
jgi:hypothetical protein